MKKLVKILVAVSALGITSNQVLADRVPIYNQSGKIIAYQEVDRTQMQRSGKRVDRCRPVEWGVKSGLGAAAGYLLGRKKGARIGAGVGLLYAGLDCESNRRGEDGVQIQSYRSRRYGSDYHHDNPGVNAAYHRGVSARERRRQRDLERAAYDAGSHHPYW